MYKKNTEESMTKIATLSFHNAYNYGAVFQVSALQYVIESLGADCDIIDYCSPAIDKQYNLKPIRLNSLFSSIRANLILLPFIKKKKKNFRHWMDSYKKTEILTREQLSSLNDRYEKFVVGSDQVWNLKCQGRDASFFLDFVNDDSKKIAYAASFGTFDVKEEDISFYKEYLEKFAFISVRETRGIELVRAISNKDSVACMDPVLLVGRNFWETKADYTNIPQEEYIFVYQLGHEQSINDYVNALKKQTKLKVVFVTGHLGNMFHYSLYDQNESSASPERFLALLIKAKYVVTNSFHATVLSILFKKLFFVVINGGEKATYNSRIYNLLEDYKLLDSIVEKYECKHLEVVRDYTSSTKILEEASSKAIQFIKSSLKL